MKVFWGILIPFFGTSLGAACVFLMKETLSDKVQRALTGFAAGVMVAASVWSLLIPASDSGNRAIRKSGGIFFSSGIYRILAGHSFSIGIGSYHSASSYE